MTFNGIDYDKNGFTFILYKIDKAFPRSGPSNGLGGDIVISGQGFRPEVNPICKFNGTIYEPLAITWNEIRCPMPAAEQGEDFFGNVEFAIAANGETWKYFEGGFQYYKNPIVEDIYPRNGPAQGIGIINFYGSGFRADFPNADLGCKIGNSVGHAVFISDTQMRCVVEDIETVAEGERLPAQAALNSYSWSELNDDDGDTGETYFVPYSVSQIFPQSGPSAGGTDVIIQGRGFVESESGTDLPRCRFGTPANYVIVDADILSYNRMACRTPEGLTAAKPVQWPADVPFSIALSSDSFEPWTQTSHKFRFYQQPTVSRVEPNKVVVGRIQEITVFIDAELDAPENVFFEPMPVRMVKEENSDEDEEGGYMATMRGFGQLKCSFGRFGDTEAVFVDENTLKCATPSVAEDPNDIYMEEVSLSVSMNGLTFANEDDDSNPVFTFEGTGEPMGLLPVVLFILALGLLIASCIYLIYYGSFRISFSGNLGNNAPAQ